MKKINWKLVLKKIEMCYIYFIDLHTAELHLYQWEKTKAWLKYLKERRKVLEVTGRLDEFEWQYTGSTTTDYTRKGYTIKTHTDPDGSKTIHDSRVESCVIEVPPQAKSPYVDEEEKRISKSTCRQLSS
ncbi:hypothetical protein F4054_19630 [Candidatus Poribacteria bacterium]|nr:hypothetical protein [Candidatus Poribacteria bacterium]